MLAIPSKRHDKRQVHFLTRPEIETVLEAPDRTRWLGRRDHTLLLFADQTGLRLSKLTGLERDAVHLGSWRTRTMRRQRAEATALFPNVHGGRLSADSVQSLLGKHVRLAHKNCPSLKAKSVSPHVLRHSAAMELLQAGVDCSVNALWLGHDGV
nr:tyrosine-type recombinase/integrase [Bradyrhizobium hipponense]